MLSRRRLHFVDARGVDAGFVALACGSHWRLAVFSTSGGVDMRRLSTCVVATITLMLAAAGTACAQPRAPRSACGPPPARNADTPPTETIALAGRLGARSLRPVDRDVTALEGSATGVYVGEGAGPGVVWVEGADIGRGTIAVDVCGRDVLQRSFLGLAFHRQDDKTYEAVYVRPFNFRADDPTRHQHAVQYIAVPENDWPQLRQAFPEEFENPVDASVDPAGWIPLRIVIAAERVQVFVGPSVSPALEVRRLGAADTGVVGLWVGNGSDGAFANLRVARSGGSPPKK
jgi:hypothetical protein